MKRILTVLLSTALSFIAYGQSVTPPDDSVQMVLDSVIESPTSFGRSAIGADLQVLNILQGRVAGLSIRSNGSLGGSINAVIRGRRSIYNNHSPLIVLDGIIIDNSEWGNSISGTDQSNRLIDINPTDIEEVKILKGIQGTAQYGIRGSNGVIELTSSDHKDSGMKLQLQSTLSVNQANKLPKLQSTYSQGRNGEYRGTDFFETFTWGPELSSLVYDGDSSYEFDSRGRLVADFGIGGDSPEPYDPTTFFGPAVSSDVNLVISNRLQSTSYYVSGAMTTVNDAVPTAGLTRYTTRLGTTYQPNSKLKATVSARYTNTSADRTQKGSNIESPVLGALRTPPSFDNSNGLGHTEALSNRNAYALADGNMRSASRRYPNPYWAVNENSSIQAVNRLIASINVQYQLSPSTTASIISGIDRHTDSREEVLVNAFTLNDDAGIVTANHLTSTTYNTNVKLSTIRTLSEQLQLKSTVGAEHYYDSDSLSLLSSNFNIGQSDPFLSLANQNSTGPAPYAINSFGAYTNNHLQIGDRGSVDLTARYDLHSTLGDNAKGLLSFAVLGKVMVMSTANGNSSDIAVVGGVSRTGNGSLPTINRLQYTPTTISSDPFLSAELPLSNAFTLSDVAVNEDLSAEITNTLEVGVDATMMQGRMDVKARYYYEKTDDVIHLQSIDPSSGFGLRYANGPSITNRGLELDIMANLINRNKLKWNINVALSTNVSMVSDAGLGYDEYYEQGLSIASSVVEAGHPVGAIRGRPFLRDSEGRLVTDDDGFPSLDFEQAIIGNPNPDMEMGIQNTVTINNRLTLSALVDIRVGGDLYCGTCSIQDYLGVSQLSADERETTTVFEGVTSTGQTNTKSVSLVTDVTRDNYRVRYGFGGLAEANTFDTSWLRLRSVRATYDLSNMVKTATGIKRMTCSVFANNLLLITNYPGIDPETNLTGNSTGFGLDYYNNPSSRTFGVSLNITFNP